MPSRRDPNTPVLSEEILKQRIKAQRSKEKGRPKSVARANQRATALRELQTAQRTGRTRPASTRGILPSGEKKDMKNPLRTSGQARAVTSAGPKAVDRALDLQAAAQEQQRKRQEQLGDSRF